ncbi:NAD(P)/FAD-dependent oxidoreductase [Streptomyces violaceus]|uniref:NAD(P)/FAD-dependent oxidoreductase n=1 Tax=Streptomyces violaceus TaxID=1936 RepID=UPI0038225D0E
MSAAGPAALAVSWWSSPIDRAVNGGGATDTYFPRLDPAAFAARGVVPMGHAAFAFVLGVALGLVIRRTLPAMATTFAVQAAVQIVVPLWIRPHLAATARTTVPIKPDGAPISIQDGAKQIVTHLEVPPVLGHLVTGLEVTRIRDVGAGAVALASDGASVRADAAVLASGAWLGGLAAPFGVRTPVQSGRGYSFSLPPDGLPTRPTYFAEQRVVCTPLGDRVRVAGMMEFTAPDRPPDPRRVQAIVNAARTLLPSADLTRRTDVWAGPRPCTPDGLPLVGPTRSPRVHVCGGHGMWGIALGPLSGKLLAESIVTGRRAPEFDGAASAAVRDTVSRAGRPCDAPELG